MKNSLQSKIATTMWIVTTFSTVAAMILTGLILVRSHRESVRSQLEAAGASLLALGISDFDALDDFEKLNLFIEDTLQMEKVEKVVRIFDQDGKLAFTTVGLEYDPLPDLLQPLPSKPVFVTLGGRQRTFESLILPYQIKGKKRSVYLQVAIPLPPYTQVLGHLWPQGVFLLAFLMVFSILVSRQLSRRLFRPVVTISDHLEGMDPTRIEDWHPLAIDQPGLYLESIVRGINVLSERTRKAVLEIRKMGRYVAHELRTPLTILQGEAETALMRKDATTGDYERVLRSSLEEVNRLSEIVTTILRISEWERSGALLRPIPCNLSNWILEMKPRWEKTLGRPLEIRMPPSGNTDILADPRLLYHLLDNLIRNVRDHARSGTQCTIDISSIPEGVRLTLSDDGPGMSPDIVDALNRGESNMATTGVGLHLCQKIAELSRLRLRFSNRPEGGLMVETLLAPL